VKYSAFATAVLTAALVLVPARGQQQSKDWTKPLASPYSVRCVAFSPDGRLLAAVTGEPKGQGKVLVWNTDQTSKPLFVYTTKHGLRSVAFAPDGKTLAAGGWSGTCYVLDAATGKQRTLLGGHGDAARAVAFSPDGKILAVGSSDKCIHLWAFEDSKKLKTLTGHDDWVNYVAFSPDGKQLASCGEDDTLRLWDPGQGTLLQTWQDGYSMGFGSKGTWLVQGGSSDAVITIRAVDGGKARVMQAGSNPYWVAVHPLGKVLAVTRWPDEEVAILPLDLREPTAEEEKTIQGLIDVWQSDSFKTREQASQDLCKLGWIADPLLAKAQQESSSAETRQRARQARAAIRKAAGQAPALRGHERTVLWGAFSPDGEVLATAGRDGVVILWDWANSKMKAKLNCR
jgi:WD40 repeat protein